LYGIFKLHVHCIGRWQRESSSYTRSSYTQRFNSITYRPWRCTQMVL